MSMGKLVPPFVYIHSLDNKEIICLLNALTGYYSQTVAYHARLYVSNNTWEPIKDEGRILGHKRKDTCISLDDLFKIVIDSDRITFEYKDKNIVEFPVTKDFFFYMEWEEFYYL